MAAQAFRGAGSRPAQVTYDMLVLAGETFPWDATLRDAGPVYRYELMRLVQKHMEQQR